jgi:hypothetical protein
MKSPLRLALLSFCLLLPLQAFAAEEMPAGYHQHDGFFIRWNYGLVATSSTENPGGGEITISGNGGSAELAIGGTIMKDLILHFDFLFTGVSEPQFEGPGGKFTADDATLGQILMGGGLTRYWMPYNIYATVAAGMGGVILVPETGPSGDTERGLALSFKVGKEWWVSDNWGLGLALQYTNISVKDHDLLGTNDMSSNAFGLSLSATYN